MPRFTCPIDWCHFHDGNDCTKSHISVEQRMDDWDTTIACKHQRNKDKKCGNCGKIFNDHGISSSMCLCIDCMVDSLGD